MSISQILKFNHEFNFDSEKKILANFQIYLFKGNAICEFVINRLHIKYAKCQSTTNKRNEIT